jgi:hypothetical protein
VKLEQALRLREIVIRTHQAGAAAREALLRRRDAPDFAHLPERDRAAVADAIAMLEEGLEIDRRALEALNDVLGPGLQ